MRYNSEQMGSVKPTRRKNQVMQLPKSNRNVTPFLIAIGVFTLIGIITGLVARPFPIQASAEAGSVDSLFNFMLAFAVVIFLIVEAGLIYSIVRFRRKPGDETDGPPDHGNTALEVTWTAIPAVIVTVLAILSFIVWNDTRSPKDGEVVVGVIGAQFKWAFQYQPPPEASEQFDEAQIEKLKSYMITDRLVLPVNRPARMDIQAQDVMHAFYVPEFRIKQDAIPGRISNAYFTPIERGEWWVLCAELCGTGHAAMSQVNRVEVMEEARYNAYVNDLYQRALNIVTDPRNPEVGKALIQQKYPCGTCHVLDDAGLVGNIGPSLNGIATTAAERAAAGEGVQANLISDPSAGSAPPGTLPADYDVQAAAYLRTAILNPNYYLAPGYSAGIMPQNYGDRTVMPDDDREAIINYLLLQK